VLKVKLVKLKQSNYLMVGSHNFTKMNNNSEVHMEVEIVWKFHLYLQYIFFYLWWYSFICLFSDHSTSCIQRLLLCVILIVLW